MSEMSTELARKEHTDLTVSADISFGIVKERLSQLQAFQKEIMQEGRDFMSFRRGDKPAVLKAGAEKLLTAFGYGVGDIIPLKEEIDRHAPADEIGGKKSLTPGHAEFVYKTVLIHIRTGAVVGTGIGSASTSEKRFVLQRTGKKWVNGKESSEPAVVFADQLNSVRKQAKKRSLVDATLTATMASGMFTQDLDDMPDMADAEESQSSGFQCPACEEGHLNIREGVSKKTKKPYSFWGCDRYPDCNYTQQEAPEEPTAKAQNDDGKRKATANRKELLKDMKSLAKECGLEGEDLTTFVNQAISREWDGEEKLSTTELLIVKEALEFRAEGASSE